MELLVVVERRAVVAPCGVDLYLCLLFEAGEQGGNGFGKVFIADFGAEVEQQFAHVVVTFLHAVGQEADVFLHLLFFAGFVGAVEHLHLQVEEGQGLCDAVVQALRNQVALLQYGKLAALLGETAVGDGYAELAAQGAQQAVVVFAQFDAV